MKPIIHEALDNALRTTLNLTVDYPIELNSRLKDDLGLDSMSTLSLLMALEELIPGFIANPDTLDTEHLSTVESIMAYIANEIAATV